MGLVFSNIPELEGTDTEIALSNLAQLEIELCEVLEKRLAHLCELAYALVQDGEDIDIIKSIILSVRSDGEVDNDDILPDNLDELRSVFSGISAVERMIIFKRVFELLPTERYRLEQSSTGYEKDAVGRIAYVQNSFNDIAFDAFSRILPDARAAYFNSAAEVCSCVSEGKCQFCLFPVEVSGDGRLRTFYDLILKHGLKINAEFDMRNARDEGYTRYALLSRDATIEQRPYGSFSHGYLQIAYTDSESISPRELLTAAEFFGLALESMETVVPSDHPHGRMIFAEFKAAAADIATFMTYLSVDCPEHLLIGLYQRI